MNRFFRFYVLSVLLLTFICSCDNNNLDCNSLSAKKLVKIIQVDIEKEKSFRYQSYGIDNLENYLNYFMDEVVEIINTRPIAKNKEIKSCDCAASMTFNLQPDLLNYLTKNSNEERIQKLDIDILLDKQGLNVEYLIQRTDDGGLYGSSRQVKGLKDAIISYYFLLQFYNEDKQKQEQVQGFKLVEYNHSVSGFDLCFKNIETKNENGESIFLLRLKVKNDNVLGQYEYHPQYGDAHWWKGEIEGKINENIIEGIFTSNTVDGFYRIPVIIELHNENAIYKESNKFFIDGLEHSNKNNQPKVLQKVDCNNIKQTISVSEDTFLE